jgi:hypothetical protein
MHAAREGEVHRRIREVGSIRVAGEGSSNRVTGLGR